MINKAEESIFRALFKKITDAESDVLDASKAVAFLRSSGLDDTILHDIWARSDPDGNGYLDEMAFCVALKLVAIAQAGLDLTSRLDSVTDTPELEGVDWHEILPQEWAISSEEKAKFDDVFMMLSKETPGKIPGHTARD
eukprot:gene7486-9795_t